MFEVFEGNAAPTHCFFARVTLSNVNKVTEAETISSVPETAIARATLSRPQLNEAKA
ncbi:MAG: hypothetical protein AAF709_17400 [Pseudomonadota bacterium]